MIPWLVIRTVWSLFEKALQEVMVAWPDCLVNLIKKPSQRGTTLNMLGQF
jgi:hypothetical protein